MLTLAQQFEREKRFTLMQRRITEAIKKCDKKLLVDFGTDTKESRDAASYLDVKLWEYVEGISGWIEVEPAFKAFIKSLLVPARDISQGE